MNGWADFYVIVGAAGSTLIGIQFIVITLVASIRRDQTSDETIAAFATPTVVHFTVALALSAIMSAPWHSRGALASAIALCGAAAFAYSLTVITRARRQTGYDAAHTDWLWYAVLPSVLYAVAIASAFLLYFTEIGLFVIAATALSLVVIGIHNAWDTVTYIVVGQPGDKS